MLVDLTYKITPELKKDAEAYRAAVNAGHFGTHFDVMDKEFPLEYLELKGVVIDVRQVENRDIDVCDVDLSYIQKDAFVMFRTGFMETEGYGTKRYFVDHPQLSYELIEAILAKGIKLIGLDCSGIRRGREHVPADQHCADNGVFVIENLYNLWKLSDETKPFTVYTLPMNYDDMTGLPCRVVAKTE